MLSYTEDNKGILPYGFSLLDLRLDRVEPWRTIAVRLDVPMPSLQSDDSIKSSPPWLCPAESKQRSGLVASSYSYPPGEFMRLWVPGRRPEPAVTRLFRESPSSLALLADALPNHAPSSGAEPKRQVGGLQRNGFFFDASARSIE